ncbi:hypothetical protein K438DRAFT_1967435 [Mycena galopus ATCC 62051]|nr:hypothetical protein K438DRAFT_1967435 [Mycena galopus ATCC 62051]
MSVSAQSSRRRMHSNPPVPSSTMPLAATDRISEALCAPLAPTWELSGLGTDGDTIYLRRARNLRLCGARARLLGIDLTGPLPVCRQHHGTFSARISSGLSSSRTDWDLGRVLSAIRASVSETPANPGMGTSHRGMHESAHICEVRPRLPPSSFNALLSAQRLNTAISLRPPPHTLYIALPYPRASGSTAPRGPRPFINDTLHTRRGLINGRYEPLATGALVPRVLSPRYVSLLPVPPPGSLALDPLSLTVSTVPSPPSVSPPRYLHPRRFFRMHLRRAPAHSPLAPASYDSFWKSSKRAQNTHAAYNELVASATSTTSRPHPPPRSRPRPAPGRHDLATQALATRRAHPISTSIRFFGDWFLHTPARNAHNARPPCAFSAWTRCPPAQFCDCATSSPAQSALSSAALVGSP